MPAVRIRVATEADVEAMFDIRTSVRENHQSREELAALGVTPFSISEMLRTSGRAWIADVNGVPAGFSLADADERTIFGMFVRPEYEGRGLGRALIAHAEQWLFDYTDEIWLTTGSDPSIRANGFYRHLGWRQGGTNERGENRYILRREWM
jgi:GNAT superfamily N-acetyltransferase